MIVVVVWRLSNSASPKRGESPDIVHSPSWRSDSNVFSHVRRMRMNILLHGRPGECCAVHCSVARDWSPGTNPGAPRAACGRAAAAGSIRKSLERQPRIERGRAAAWAGAVVVSRQHARGTTPLVERVCLDAARFDIARDPLQSMLWPRYCEESVPKHALTHARTCCRVSGKARYGLAATADRARACRGVSGRPGCFETTRRAIIHTRTTPL